MYRADLESLSSAYHSRLVQSCIQIRFVHASGMWCVRIWIGRYDNLPEHSQAFLENSGLEEKRIGDVLKMC